MKLSRKKAIELCIKLWEWLAKTGKQKNEWPEWEKYDNVQNNCWFCQYTKPYIGSCNICPLVNSHITPKIEGCSDTYYNNWSSAKTPRTCKKYAKLFLEQIKSTQRKR